MRVVTLEEHFTVPALAKRISREAVSKRGFGPRNILPGRVNPLELAPEIGEQRLRSMDENGITVQVLSTTGPGADLVDGAHHAGVAADGARRLRRPHPDQRRGRGGPSVGGVQRRWRRR